MADYTKYTKQEMQAYAIAKNIKENQIVIVGTGLPLIGASLAKRVVCPSCHPIVESGLMDCSPVEVPRSVGDNRFMITKKYANNNLSFVNKDGEKTETFLSKDIKKIKEITSSNDESLHTIYVSPYYSTYLDGDNNTKVNLIFKAVS